MLARGCEWADKTTCEPRPRSIPGHIDDRLAYEETCYASQVSSCYLTHTIPIERPLTSLISGAAHLPLLPPDSQPSIPRGNVPPLLYKRLPNSRLENAYLIRGMCTATGNDFHRFRWKGNSKISDKVQYSIFDSRITRRAILLFQRLFGNFYCFRDSCSV